MISSSIRNYLILLFIAVAGVGLYLIVKQNNDDFDASMALNGQSFKTSASTPKPKATATPAATAAATTKTTAASIKPDQEAADIDSIVNSVSATDFNDSTLNDKSIGL